MNTALVVFGKKAVPIDQLAVSEWLEADLAKEDNLRYAIGTVFSYWVAKTRRRPTQTLLSPERGTKIRQRILEQGSAPMAELVSPLLWAIDGLASSDWHMNVGGRATELEFIFRKRSNLEEFAEKMQGYRDEKLHPLICVEEK